jgi:hypothetical protein
MAASRTTATTGGTPRFGDESNGGGEAQRGDFAKKKTVFLRPTWHAVSAGGSALGPIRTHVEA